VFNVLINKVLTDDSVVPYVGLQLDLSEEIRTVEVRIRQSDWRPAEEMHLFAVISAFVQVGAERVWFVRESEYFKWNNLYSPP
jgi:hypothetical protein